MLIHCWYILKHIDTHDTPHHLDNCYPTLQSSILSFSTLHPGDLRDVRAINHGQPLLKSQLTYVVYLIQNLEALIDIAEEKKRWSTQILIVNLHLLSSISSTFGWWPLSQGHTLFRHENWGNCSTLHGTRTSPRGDCPRAYGKQRQCGNNQTSEQKQATQWTPPIYQNISYNGCTWRESGK